MGPGSPFLETLVLWSCLTHNCTVPYQAYYAQSPGLQQMQTNAEKLGDRIVKKHVPTWLVFAVAPAAAVIAGKGININLGGNKTLVLDPRNERIAIAYHF